MTFMPGLQMAFVIFLKCTKNKIFLKPKSILVFPWQSSNLSTVSEY